VIHSFCSWQTPDSDAPAPWGVERGIPMRDFFAAMALQALDIQAHVSRPSAEQLAESAYNIADAMLKVRKV
jgi:hypothetical protein